MLDRKTAIVTGASRGIGKGIAFLLAEQGYDLFLTHLAEQDEAEEVCRRITKQYGRKCEIAQADLSVEETPQWVVEQAVQEFGKVHLLVNNAGVTLFDHLTDMPSESINYLIHLNFRAPMLTTKHIALHMIQNKIPGSIVQIVSSRAERAYPIDSIYGGMKSALVRASQSVALELAAYGIRVNTIAPGAIDVRAEYQDHYEQLGRRIPLGRVGTPEDVARAVAWISSDAASYITGVNVRVDGGLILSGMPENTDGNQTDAWGEGKK
jgi:glucose 1-dehydrogenase